jgi:glutamate synthase (NADPH/NADH) large chain
MERVVVRVIEDEGQTVLGWRDVPSDNSSLSKAPEIVATEPCHRQVIIGRGSDVPDEDAFERKLYVIRKVMSAKI